MFIEEVIISGFRSFRNETRIRFDQRVNAIVGDNGSGKSTLFTALHLVLGGQLSSSENERRFLISNGVDTATIEVVFNNDSGRLPMKPKKITVRREISITTDGFYVNDSRTKIDDVRCMFEAAGMAQRNPYYHVGQGAIVSMMNKTDQQRYEFTEKAFCFSKHGARYAATKINMAAVDALFDSIEQQMTSHRVKLDSLKVDGEALKEIKLLKERVGMFKRAIYVKQQDKLQRKLKQMETKIGMCIESLSESTEQFEELKDKIAEAESERKRKAEMFEKQNTELRVARYERDELLEHRIGVESAYADLEKIIQEKESKKETLSNELHNLRDEVVDDDRARNELDALVRTQKNLVQDLKEEISKVESGKRQLYFKLNRQGMPVDEVKRHISLELDRNREAHKTLKETITKVDKTVASLRSEIETLRAEIESLRGGVPELAVVPRDRETNKSMDQLVIDNDSLLDERRTLESEEHQLMESNFSLKAELRKVENSIFKFRYQNYCAVNNLLSEMRTMGEKVDEEHHSLVLEQVECKPGFQLAASVVGGARLFNRIVQTDSFATRLTKLFNERKLHGSLNLIAMNRVRAPNVNTEFHSDEIRNREMVPLINYMKFDEKFSTVMKSVFGRAMFCKTLPSRESVKNSGWDYVTLDGDFMTARGAISGGYFKSNASILDLQCERRNIEQKTREHVVRLRKIHQTIDRINVQSTTLMKKIENLKRKVIKAKGNMDDLRSTLNAKTEELESREQSVLNECRHLTDLNLRNQVLTREIEFLERLLRNGVQLTDQDEIEMGNLTRELTNFQIRYRDEFNKLMKYERRLTERSTQFSYKQKRIQDLEKIISDLTLQIKAHTDNRNQKEFLRKKYEQMMKRNLRVIEDLQKKLEEFMSDEDMQIDEMKTRFREVADAKNTLMERLAYLELKRANIAKEWDELSIKIGFISVNCRLDRGLSDMSMDELMENMNNLNDEINRKENIVDYSALGKYKIMSDIINRYARKRVALGQEKSSIMKVTDIACDYLKYLKEALEMVCKQFKIIFKRLVPEGEAKLILQYDCVDETREAVVGLGCKACFSQESDVYDWAMLSGGQKTIISLAFIFALQACDRSPIYLFDEVDTHLDHAVRERLAQILKDTTRQEESCQYIISNFNPEFVRIADRCLQIRVVNRVPTVEPISIEEALRFIARR